MSDNENEEGAPEEPEYVSDESEAEEPREPKEEREQMLGYIKTGLKVIAKTADNDGYAFSQLSMNEKDPPIRKMFRYLRNYPHLKYVNLAQNTIRDISILRNIPYLITLQAQENKIEDISIFTEEGRFSYLQLLDLSKNRARLLPAITCPRLRTLNLSECKVATLAEFKGHPSLEVLNVSTNRLKSLEGISNCPKLKTLLCAGNKISDLGPMDKCEALEFLDLTTNQMKEFPEKLPSLPCLNRLSIKENQFAKFAELEKLVQFPKLRDITCDGNPMDEEVGDVKKELLIKMPDQWNKINEEDIQQEERQEAEAEKLQRIADEEEKKRLAEQGEGEDGEGEDD